MSTWREEEKQIKRPLLYLTGGLVLGETMALWITEKGILLGLALAAAVFLLLCKKRCAGPARFVLITVFAGWLLGALCMGGTAARLLKAERIAEKISAESGKNGWVLTGKVAEHEETASGEKWVLTGCEIVRKGSGEGEPAGQKTQVPGKVLCYVDGGDVPAGSLVAVTGSLRAIKPPANPGEYDFRYSCFSRGIGCQFYGESEVVLQKGRRTLKESLRGVRERLGYYLELAAEPKDAGILKAVLLGDRKELDGEIFELYRRNGISHLLAISGLHMSVLGMGLWNLLRKAGCGRGASGLLAGGALILYGMLTGFSPSVFRAVFMLLISFLADWLGRTYDLISALCAAAFCLLAAFPFLLTQASFQLSFLAVAGIVFLGQPLVRSFSENGEEEGGGPVFQAFLISFSVQAATLPAILYHSFEIPLYGVFLNLLVIPPMAGVLYSGLGAMAFACIWRAAAVFLLGGGHFILQFYEWICKNVQGLPGAVLCFGRPKLWQILLYYSLVLFGARILKKRKFLVLWVFAFLVLLPVKKGGLTVTFLDVGQGDGILLEGNGRKLLVDCGSTQNKKLGEYSLVPFLKSRGITSLDAVVVTHGDQDHISGIQYLLENPEAGIEVQRLLMPEAGRGEEVYAELEAQALKNRTEAGYIGRGDRIFAEETLDIECLYPSEKTLCRNRNDQSVVLLLTYGRFRLLLTGDMEEAGERELTGLGDLKQVTVLKAGHHGSATSSCRPFLEAVSPVETVLSYGEGNRYGHPDAQVKERLWECGSRIWETARSGAVEVWTDGKRMKIHGFRKMCEE